MAKVGLMRERTRIQKGLNYIYSYRGIFLVERLFLEKIVKLAKPKISILLGTYF